MSDKQTVTLEYPGEAECGVSFDAWRQTMQMVASNERMPRFEVLKFLLSVVSDGGARLDDRMHAARLAIEATK